MRGYFLNLKIEKLSKMQTPAITVTEFGTSTCLAVAFTCEPSLPSPQHVKKIYKYLKVS